MMRVCICTVSVMVALVGAARVAVEVHNNADTNRSGVLSVPIPLQAGCQPCVSTWTGGQWSIVGEPPAFVIQQVQWCSACARQRSVHEHRVAFGTGIAIQFVTAYFEYPLDIRDSNSRYAFSTDRIYSAGKWSLEEGERGGTYRLVYGGWYLASDATSARDKRNHQSNYLILTRHAENANHWLFECGSRDGWYFIRLADDNADQPAGWYLSEHGTEYWDLRGDDECRDGNYLIVHSGLRWANQYALEVPVSAAGTGDWRNESFRVRNCPE